MADIKWSAFPSTAAAAASGDTLVGLHSGANYQFDISATPVALAMTQWDSSKNLSANNTLNAYTTTATASGTTTLTVASTYFQYFTGTLGQTLTMPVTSTLVLGQSWYVVNNSTGSITVNSSGGNLIVTMEANTSALITCILTSGTTASSWNATYFTDTGEPVGTLNHLQRYDGTDWVQSTNATLDASDVLSALTQLNVDNLRLDGNTLSSTDTNGNVNIDPDGTGHAVVLGQNATIETDLVSTSATGFPAISMYRNTSTQIGRIQAGVNDAFNATGDGLFIYNPVVGGSVFVRNSTGNALKVNGSTTTVTSTLTVGNLSLNGNTISSAAATNIILAPGTTGKVVGQGTNATFETNLISTNATGFPSLSFYRNTSTLIGWIQGGVNDAFNATGDGMFIYNPVVGGSIFLRNSTGNALQVNGANTTLSGSLTTSQTAGIIGTTTNNDANAGSVGQYISSQIVVGAAVSLTTATPANVTSISLTAGDWDVWGNITFLVRDTTSVTSLVGWISSASASVPDASLFYPINYSTPYVSTGNTGQGLTPPTLRFSLSGTTTIYLSCQGTFSIAALDACGGIYARRRR